MLSLERLLSEVWRPRVYQLVQEVQEVSALPQAPPASLPSLTQAVCCHIVVIALFQHHAL